MVLVAVAAVRSFTTLSLFARNGRGSDGMLENEM